MHKNVDRIALPHLTLDSTENLAVPREYQKEPMAALGTCPRAIVGRQSASGANRMPVNGVSRRLRVSLRTLSRCDRGSAIVILRPVSPFQLQVRSYMGSLTLRLRLSCAPTLLPDHQSFWKIICSLSAAFDSLVARFDNS